MKHRPLPQLEPIRQVVPVWERSGAAPHACLPAVRRVPPPPETFDFANMSDEMLQRLEPVARLLQTFDWHWRFSDDARVYVHGAKNEKALDAALAALPLVEAQSLWFMYAPKDMGAYRR
jgi:hypothetical protein